VNVNKPFFDALSVALFAGVAQAKVSCETFKTGVNATLGNEGKVPLEWESAQSFNGFNSVNPAAGIKAAIECNDSGDLIELGASVPFFNDIDRSAEPVFVRGMLVTLDPKMTPQKADDLAYKARQRLRSTSKATGSHSVPVAGYTVVFEKAPDGNGGLRFRYELEAKK
jgi:hypothetical protein